MADWGTWIGLATAAAGAYTASQQASANKKAAQNNQNNYQDAMRMEQERVDRARNSPFSKIAMTMLDQGLHIYGDKTKGMGGFTMPVDQLSAMLGNFGSYGDANNPDNAQGWQGQNNGNPGVRGQENNYSQSDSVSPALRQAIEERKARYAALGAEGLSRGAGRQNHRPEYAAGSMFNEPIESISSGGGAIPSFDAMFNANYEDRLARKGITRGLTAEDVMGGNLGDNIRNAAWGYAGKDGNILGKGTTGGELKQGAYRLPLQFLPSGISQAASLGLREVDKTTGWMYDYNNWGKAPQQVWDVSPQMYNYYANGGTGYGSSEPFVL